MAGRNRNNAARRRGGTVLAGVFSEGEAGHDGAWWPTAGFGVWPRWWPRGAARGGFQQGFLMLNRTSWRLSTVTFTNNYT